MKLTTLISVLGILFSSTSSAQSDSSSSASFPGGEEKLFEYLGKNLNYPQSAKAREISGIVYASFLLTNTGEIDSVWIVRGVDPLLDDEVVQAIRAMPSWVPARLDGDEVNCRIDIPLGFYLTEHGKMADTTVFSSSRESNGCCQLLEQYMTLQYTVNLLGGGGHTIGQEFEANYTKGSDALKSGNYKDALQYLNKVYRADPENPDILYKLGVTKYKLDNLKGACRTWKRAKKYGSVEASETLSRFCESQ